MNLIEVFKEIKSYSSRDDIKINSFLIARFQGSVSDNVRVCIRVKDGLIALSAFPITVYDMLADDWELLTHYKIGNSYEELEQ